MTEYCYPATIAEAVALLERRGGEARIIAGGTDLVPDLRKGKIESSCLVDVTRIPDLSRIEIDADWVTVGAAVTFGMIREHVFLQQRVHALVEAARSVGAAAIQNAATWVGNIVQAMPAADGAIVAVALGAEAEIVNGDGARWEPVEGLFEGPGCSRVNSQLEMVTRVRFGRPGARTGTGWQRVGRRAALVLPILNCAVLVELERGADGDGQGAGEDEVIAKARIALGPVAPRPARARESESFLRGQLPRPEVLEKAGQIARGEAHPRTSVMRASKEYRLDILPTLVTEALTRAVERARPGKGLDGASMDEKRA